MKKYISISLAVMALTLAGCAGGPFSEEDVNVITIKAVMAENNTRTVIQEGTTSVLWEQADEIKVFYDGIGSRFANQNTSPSGTAKFSGSLNVVFGSNEGFSDSTPLWGLYPYRADATADNTSVTTTLPAEQTGRAGSFAKGMNITLGKSSSLVMGFYNVCGGIRFSLTQEGVKDVIFEGQNNENIAGKVKIAFADGVPTIQQVVEGQKTITLSAPNGGTFETGKWYFIVALPGTFSNGFKMTFNTDTQYATLKSSGSKTIKRGIFGSLADADEDLIYKDKGGDEPPTGNIVFADIAAKYACVAKFDTNGDGEVSIEEAETATSFSGLFTNWNTVESFDEIRYFKNVHGLSGVFKDCNQLVSITIPENITNLGTYAFSDCSSLTNVVLPSGITAIGNYTFQNCSSLSSIDIPENVVSVGQYAFKGCSSLTAVELPSSVTAIANYAFQNCSSLTSVDIPSNVTSVGQYAFSGCSSLSTIVLPTQMTSIPDGLFYNCSSLKSIVWPSSLQSIGARSFYGCVVSQDNSVASVIELPSTVTNIGSKAFCGVRHLIMPSPSAIVIASDSFISGYTKLYVPSGMVEMYKVRTNWSNYERQLYTISDYPVSGYAEPELVDLGLPSGLKWASFNLGATKPEEYGDYFAWGEVEPKFEYMWSTYKWCKGSVLTMTKYCTKTEYGFNGFTDGKTVLEMTDDAAAVNLGGRWRMPTSNDWSELRSNCSWTWTTINGVYGSKGTSNVSGYTDKWVFFPATGRRSSTYVYDLGSKGFYWSSSLYPPEFAIHQEVNSSGGGWFASDRCEGKSIRPVSD